MGSKAEVVTELLRPAQAVRPAVTPWLDWDDKVRFAQQLVQTGFLPKAVDTAGKALAIIFAGQEIGIPPMHALRSINVIQGKPSMSAELMLALFKQRGGRAIWKESTDERAVLWLRHPNGDDHTESFSLEDGKRAGLLGKDGWRFYPKAMLRARCASAGLRAVAPDIIAGIYDPEELGGEGPIEGEDVLPPAAPPPIPEAETEPESGRQEVPVATDEAPIPLREWLASFEATTPETLEALWRGVRLPAVWTTLSVSDQVAIGAAYNAAKRRLGVS